MTLADRDVDLAHDDHHRLGDRHDAEHAHDACGRREVVDREEVRRRDPHDHEHHDEHEQEPLALNHVDRPPPARKLLLAPHLAVMRRRGRAWRGRRCHRLAPDRQPHCRHLPVSRSTSSAGEAIRASAPPDTTPRTVPALVTRLVRRRESRHTSRGIGSVYLQCAIGFVAVTSVPAMPMFDEYGILFAMRMIVATADSPHFSGSRKSAPT